jgi:hypothetical protein
MWESDSIRRTAKEVGLTGAFVLPSKTSSAIVWARSRRPPNGYFGERNPHSNLTYRDTVVLNFSRSAVKALVVVLFEKCCPSAPKQFAEKPDLGCSAPKRGISI